MDFQAGVGEGDAVAPSNLDGESRTEACASAR
jgi:hypothetical protein